MAADAAAVLPPGMDLFAPGSARVAVFVAFRLGGLLAVAPVFSHRALPAPQKAALLVLLTMVLQPLVLATHAAAAAPGLTLAALLSESLVGLTMGLGAALLIGASQAAGDYIAQHIALGGASALDPISNESSPIVGQFLSLTTLALLLASNLHLELIAALAASFRVVPPGAVGIDVEQGLLGGALAGSALFALGLRFAGPILVAGMLANVGLGLIARAAPAMNILALAFPIQIGLGLITLGAMLPVLATALTHAPHWLDHVSAVLLDNFVHGVAPGPLPGFGN